MNRVLCAVILVIGNIAYAQDHVGSGRALKLDGVDDYVDLGNIYDNAVLPITISAWLYFEPDAGPATIFASQNSSETLVSKGFVLNVSRQSAEIQYGDGTGSGTAFLRGKAAHFPDTGGKWFHITGVLNSYSDMSIYLNGVEVSLDYVGSAAHPMASNFPNDFARIGYRSSDNIAPFKGMIDELRIWNRALTNKEIRDKMCMRLTGMESGLTGYWNFDEPSGNTIFDSSSKGFQGTLINGTERVFSGAPVGDYAAHLYTNDWWNLHRGMTFLAGDHSIIVTDVKGDPPGIYIYTVWVQPSQQGGLDPSKINAPYLGVFLARTNYTSSPTFSLRYEIKTEPVCEFDIRNDNSVANWTHRQELLNVAERIEVMAYPSAQKLNLDLGADRAICDNTSTRLVSGFATKETLFSWSTGETTSDITVDTPGFYSLQVKRGCGVGYDTIEVFRLTPHEFEFTLQIQKESLCESKYKLISGVPPAGKTFQWSTGATTPDIEVGEPGTYALTVTVADQCLEGTDVVQISEDTPIIKPNNVITPDNGDMLNQYFELEPPLEGSAVMIYNRWGKQVFATSSYQNDWCANGLATGIYFYRIDHECGEYTGSIKVIK